MGMWIVVAIVLFVLGSMMALKPSGVDIRLDTLRMSARKLGLNPKLIACPDWVAGKDGEFGRGMIGQYGLVLDDIKLPLSRYQVIDGQWRPISSSDPLPPAAPTAHFQSRLRAADHELPPNVHFGLDKSPLDLPPSIGPYVKALATQANSIVIYWEDIAYVRPISNPNYKKDAIEPDLLALKAQLKLWADRMQAQPYDRSN